MEFELNTNQLDYLKRIRRVRARFILKVYVGLLTIPIFFIIMSISENGLPHELNWSIIIEHFYVPIFISILIIVLASIPIIIIYLVRLHPLAKDIRKRTGIKKNKQIIRKNYFHLTDEYYLFFQEVKMPNIKVDHLTYNHYAVGDYFSISTAKYSKEVFENYDRFEIL